MCHSMRNCTRATQSLNVATSTPSSVSAAQRTASAEPRAMHSTAACADDWRRHVSSASRVDACDVVVVVVADVVVVDLSTARLKSDCTALLCKASSAIVRPSGPCCATADIRSSRAASTAAVAAAFESTSSALSSGSASSFSTQQPTSAATKLVERTKV